MKRFFLVFAAIFAGGCLTASRSEAGSVHVSDPWVALSFTGRDITHQGTIGGLAGTSTTGTPIGIAGTGGIAVGTIIEMAATSSKRAPSCLSERSGKIVAVLLFAQRHWIRLVAFGRRTY
jgi:hypothetical protein